MNKYILFFIIIGFLSRGYADQALELLKATDIARGSIGSGLTWKSEIETVKEQDKSVRKFDIKVKGDDAYVEATAPDRNKGEIYLFNNRNMWFFKPSLKKPVSISAKQKLAGQAANGDIASTNYARDYNPSIEKEETIGGEKFIVLMLKAKSSNLTYDAIRYWVSDKNKLAMKAEFLDLQGKAFKRAEMKYGNSIQYKGKKYAFVSELKISDAKYENDYSVIRYSAPQVTTHPDSIFKVNNLTR